MEVKEEKKIHPRSPTFDGIPFCCGEKKIACVNPNPPPPLKSVRVCAREGEGFFPNIISGVPILVRSVAQEKAPHSWITLLFHLRSAVFLSSETSLKKIVQARNSFGEYRVNEPSNSRKEKKKGSKEEVSPRKERSS